MMLKKTLLLQLEKKKNFSGTGLLRQPRFKVNYCIDKRKL
jgi:hypothetical protein